MTADRGKINFELVRAPVLTLTGRVARVAAPLLCDQEPLSALRCELQFLSQVGIPVYPRAGRGAAPGDEIGIRVQPGGCCNLAGG